MGFQKTGTTSLGLALEKLGYQVCGYSPFREFAKNEDFDVAAFQQKALELSEQYDAFKDSPWPLFYKEMDERYPGSKFILVERDKDKWIKSVVDDFGKYPNSIRNYTYGVPVPTGNEDIFIRRFERHCAEVRDYFDARPEDLLDINLDKGEVNWENICSFLGEPLPDTPWPRANTKNNKRMRMVLYKIMSRLSFNKN